MGFTSPVPGEPDLRYYSHTWTTAGSGLVIVSGGQSGHVDVTSTSTVHVSNAMGLHWLAMFGVQRGNLMAVRGFEDASPVQTPNVACRGIAEPYEDPETGAPSPNIAYLLSNRLHDVASAPRAGALGFVLDLDEDPQPLKSTAIPSKTGVRLIDGVECAPIYKDPHVLEPTENPRNGCGGPESAGLKDVDAVPRAFDGGMALYFSANVYPVGESAWIPHRGWGIRRSVAAPAPAGRTFGADFVVRAVLGADQGGAYDLVVRTEAANLMGPLTGPIGSGNAEFVGTGSPGDVYLDPDPVRLPRGDWIVFAGGGSGGLERFETNAAVAERTYAEAWR